MNALPPVDPSGRSLPPGAPSVRSLPSGNSLPRIGATTTRTPTTLTYVGADVVPSASDAPPTATRRATAAAKSHEAAIVAPLPVARTVQLAQAAVEALARATPTVARRSPLADAGHAPPPKSTDSLDGVQAPLIQTPWLVEVDDNVFVGHDRAGPATYVVTSVDGPPTLSCQPLDATPFAPGDFAPIDVSPSGSFVSVTSDEQQQTQVRLLSLFNNANSTEPQSLRPLLAAAGEQRGVMPAANTDVVHTRMLTDTLSLIVTAGGDLATLQHAGAALAAVDIAVHQGQKLDVAVLVATRRGFIVSDRSGAFFRVHVGADGTLDARALRTPHNLGPATHLRFLDEQLVGHFASAAADKVIGYTVSGSTLTPTWQHALRGVLDVVVSREGVCAIVSDEGITVTRTDGNHVLTPHPPRAMRTSAQALFDDSGVLFVAYANLAVAFGVDDTGATNALTRLSFAPALRFEPRLVALRDGGVAVLTPDALTRLRYE